MHFAWLGRHDGFSTGLARSLQPGWQYLQSRRDSSLSAREAALFARVGRAGTQRPGPVPIGPNASLKPVSPLGRVGKMRKLAKNGNLWQAGNSWERIPSPNGESFPRTSSAHVLRRPRGNTT